MNARLVSSRASLCGAVVSLLGCGGAPTPAASEVPSLLSVARPESCAGATLSSTTLDVDLSLVHLRGAITLNGQPLPQSALERGQLVLVDSRSATVQQIALGSNGTGAMDVLVPKGTYEVRYVPPRCDLVRDAAMPCTPMVLERALSVQGDTNRDFALKSVMATFAVTLDGAASPSPEGSLVLENDAGVSSQLQIASLAPVPVWPGAYRVRYASASNCSAAEQRWPCNDGVVARDVSIEAARAVAVGVRTTLVTATVRANGAPATFGTPTSRVSLRDSSGSSTATLVTTRTGSLGPMRLLQDRYELFWAPISDGSSSASSMPSNRGRLAELALSGPTHNATIDVQTVLAQGPLTLDGAPAVNPANPARGVVFFVDEEKNRFSELLTADSRFEIRLFRGSRGTLGYDTNHLVCGGAEVGGTTIAPCGEALFTESTVFDADRTAAAAMTTVTAPLSLTVDGQSLTSSGTGALSTLFIASKIPGARPAALSLTNSARLRVVKGTYSITSVEGVGAGGGCTAAMALPCGMHLLDGDRSITANEPIALSVLTRRITGAVRINGVQPTFVGEQAPYVGLFSRGAEALSTRVLNGAPATYRAHVIDGPVVGYINGVTGCSLDEPSDTRPLCGVSFFAGCAAR
jgi:hypothetical protein